MSNWPQASFLVPGLSSVLFGSLPLRCARAY